MKTPFPNASPNCGAKPRKNRAPLHRGIFLLAALSLGAASALSQEGTTPAQANDAEAMPATAHASPAAKSEIKRENLITNSPFRTARILNRTGGNTQQLEIRGFSGSGDKLEVSLTNPLTRECHWVKVGDPDARWKVTSADPAARTAIVEINGMVISVSMAQVDERPLGITSSAAPKAPSPVLLRTAAGGVFQPGNISGQSTTGSMGRVQGISRIVSQIENDGRNAAIQENNTSNSTENPTQSPRFNRRNRGNNNSTGAQSGGSDSGSGLTRRVR
jgi:hypothetical protein